MLINSPQPDEDATLFGNIVLQWGHLESKLLNILLRLTNPLFDLDVEQFPQPLSSRIKLARRGYAKIPAMASLKDEALPLLDNLWPLSKQRHIIVHGYYQGFTGAILYEFTTYRRSGAEGRFQFHYFTHAELLRLNENIQSASRRLCLVHRTTHSSLRLEEKARCKTDEKDLCRKGLDERAEDEVGVTRR